MENIPKIVSERLRVAAAGAVGHPDANVLTAFAEHSLTERERAGVMEHLARCGECRDVIALALPATESAQTVQLVAPSHSWFAWRWGFAITGIVVIASFGLLQYQHRTQKPSVAAYVKPRAEEEKATAQNQPLPTVAAPEKQADKFEAAVPANKPPAAPAAKLRDDEVVGTAPATSGNLHRQFAHGPLQLNQLQQNTNNNQVANQVASASPAPSASAGGGATASRVQIPAATEQVEVSAQSPPVQVEAQNSLTVQNEPIVAQPSAGHDEMKVDRAKPAQTVIGSYKKAISAAPLPPQGLAVGGPVIARWNINASGGLQRSLDQGASWQDVAVNGAAVGAAGAELSANFAKSSVSPARVKAKDSGDQNSAVAPPVFRAVVANGADVWAGGANAVLYHSIDAGSHWTHIVVSSAGSSPTGDIVALDFPDAAHGKVSTSTSEVWVTSDGGQNWLKQ